MEQRSSWLHAALFASVTGLSRSCTMGDTVEVLAAWIDDEDCLCVVYQYPAFDGVLGLRRDPETDMYGEVPSDPGAYGQDIADFDIGEPLGTVAEHLRVDEDGVHWWGSLDAELPVLLDSGRLRDVIASAREAHERRRAEQAARPRRGHLAEVEPDPHTWVLFVQPTGETAFLSQDEATASDEEIKTRFNLASLSRGGH